MAASNEERRATAQTIVVALMLDMKHVSAVMDLPYAVRLELMENLGLLPLLECEGETTKERLKNWQNRIERCQHAIKKLRGQ